MSNIQFIREWTRLKDEVLKPAEMSVPDKVLAYKLFLRPMLVYSWLKNNSGELKALEVLALKDIFGKISVSSLYEQFTDCDIRTFVQVEKIRWSKGTAKAPGYVQEMLKVLSANPTRYFKRSCYRDHQRPILDSNCTDSHRRTRSKGKHPNSEPESSSSTSESRNTRSRNSATAFQNKQSTSRASNPNYNYHHNTRSIRTRRSTTVFAENSKASTGINQISCYSVILSDSSDESSI